MIEDIIATLENDCALDEFSRYLFFKADKYIRKEILLYAIDDTNNDIVVDFNGLGKEESFSIIIPHKWFVKKVYEIDRSLFRKIYNQFISEKK